MVRVGTVSRTFFNSGLSTRLLRWKTTSFRVISMAPDLSTNFRNRGRHPRGAFPMAAFRSDRDCGGSAKMTGDFLRWVLAQKPFRPCPLAMIDGSEFGIATP